MTASTLQAVATAFASAFSIATNECGDLCDADTIVVSDAIGKVLAKATSKVYKEQCDGTISSFWLTVL